MIDEKHFICCGQSTLSWFRLHRHKSSGLCRPHRRERRGTPTCTPSHRAAVRTGPRFPFVNLSICTWPCLPSRYLTFQLHGVRGNGQQTFVPGRFRSSWWPFGAGWFANRSASCRTPCALWCSPVSSIRETGHESILPAVDRKGKVKNNSIDDLYKRAWLLSKS